MVNKPRSAYDKAGGMAYFPRMLDKIRLFADDQLHPDFHPNLGKGADGWCCDFLRVPYPDLRVRVLTGGTDEQVLEWCFTTGRRLNEIDLRVWNAYITKLGWNDDVTPTLNKRKAESGLADRDDIVTMPEYFEVDEGRKA